MDNFREMRRKERLGNKDDILRIFNEGKYGVLAVSGDNEYPYAVPLSYVYLNDAIYFHCAGGGHKLDSVRKHSKVSFCVIGRTNILPEKFTTEYESVIAFGKAEIVDEEEKVEVLRGFIKKYSEDFAEQGEKYIEKAKHKTIIVKIKIENITAKIR